MQIRSVTAFTNLTLDEPEIALAQAANFLHNAVHAFEEAGFTVQTRRVATQPFPRILDPVGPLHASDLARQVLEVTRSYGIDFVSLGPVDATDDPEYVEAIPDMIAYSSAVFLGVNIASPKLGIDVSLLKQTAEIILYLAELLENGMGNLYLAALANVRPGAPFFPAAYHAEGAPPAFALAIQAADLAVEAFAGAKTLRQAQQRLTTAVTAAAQRLTAVAERLSREFDIQFGGIDFSLAPYPADGISLGGAMEHLGITLGGAGGAAAAALIMTALDRAQFQRAGFSGLMLPVLEDSVLARRASEGVLSTNDLLLYSAICGTGLDTIPLPGDITWEALTGLLLDTAALSLRLDKPLTARLMPLPEKAAGDDTGIDDFEYFAPARVMAAPTGVAPDGLMYGDDIFKVKTRVRRR